MKEYSKYSKMNEENERELKESYIIEENERIFKIIKDNCTKWKKIEKHHR